MAIVVPKLEEDKQAIEALLLANRDKSLGDSAHQQAAKHHQAPEEVLPLQQMVSVDRTPRQKYDEKLKKAGLLSGNIREGMERLFEMGFVEFEINLTLMKRYGHFGAAAEHLISHGVDGII